MTQQPEALRLADLIDENSEAPLVVKAAAAELRRLHARDKEWESVTGFMQNTIDRMEKDLLRLHSVNAQLLEALEEAADDIESWGAYATEYFQKRHNLQGAINKARAAIAAAKGEA